MRNNYKTKQIRDNWERTGLLEAIPNEDKEKIALYYEIGMVLLLLEDGDDETSGRFEQILFPIIRRIYTLSIKKELSIEDIFKKTKEFLYSEEYKNAEEEDKKDTCEVDMEAELTSEFCDKYAEELNKIK